MRTWSEEFGGAEGDVEVSGDTFRHEKFICRLPDKDKKIFDSVAKLEAATAEREEIRGKSELFPLPV